MVRVKLSRFAFTLIELIFAIVIIGIAVLSLPVMTQITSKGIESNILQEAIFAGSAELMGATAYYWDRDSMQDSDFSHLSRVIDIGAIRCENNASSPRYRLRTGHIEQPFHRRCLDSNETTSANVSDAGFPNLNNAVHVSQTIFTDETANASGYKESYRSIVTVEHLDQTGAANVNVKKITVTVTDSATPAKDITRLSTYSANIGEIDYYKRRF